MSDFDAEEYESFRLDLDDPEAPDKASDEDPDDDDRRRGRRRR